MSADVAQVTGVGDSDRRMAVIGGCAVTLSVGAVVVRSLGILPSSAASVMVLVGVAIALRVALSYAARSASSPTRARVLSIVSNVGLAISTVTLVASLPHLTGAGGTGKFVGDVFAHLWTLALLTIAAGPIRTLGWRAYAGVGFVGFLAVPAMSRLVGTPVVHQLGSDSLVATALWAPVTEEVLKASPVLLILLLVARRADVRPAALDVLLLGTWTGAGFALYEDATYGRGGFAWSADAPFSLLVPSELRAGGGSSIVAGGHLVYTGLLALGLGISVLYRRRYRWAWLAAPVAFLVVLGEHIAVNAQPLLTRTGAEPAVERILSPLTLGGRLSTLMLIAGVIGAVIIERRSIRPVSPPAQWPRLSPTEAARRMGQLALAQQQSLPAQPAAYPHTASSPEGYR